VFVLWNMSLSKGFSVSLVEYVTVYGSLAECTHNYPSSIHYGHILT
jgi:hypothetical protein